MIINRGEAQFKTFQISETWPDIGKYLAKQALSFPPATIPFKTEVPHASGYSWEAPEFQPFFPLFVLNYAWTTLAANFKLAKYLWLRKRAQSSGNQRQGFAIANAKETYDLKPYFGQYFDTKF